MPLANRNQRLQLCRQAVSQVSILIVARHHPDCRALHVSPTGTGAAGPVAYVVCLTGRAAAAGSGRIDSTICGWSLQGTTMIGFVACLEGLDDPSTGTAGRHDLL